MFDDVSSKPGLPKRGFLRFVEPPTAGTIYYCFVAGIMYNYISVVIHALSLSISTTDIKSLH